MNAELIISILELIVKYGITAVIDILKAFGKEEITLEDIEKLKGLIKKPEEYFDKPQE